MVRILFWDTSSISSNCTPGKATGRINSLVALVLPYSHLVDTRVG